MATRRGYRNPSHGKRDSGKTNFTGLFEAMARDLRLKTEGLPDRVFQVFEEESDQQVSDMQKHTRVLSGEMLASVGKDAQKHSTQLTVNVGYLKGPWQDYYYYNDEGFTHWRSGSWIDGTHAMVNAYNAARIRIAFRLRDLGLKGKAF